MEFIEQLISGFFQFFQYTGFANVTIGHILMLMVGSFFIYLGIAKEYEPLLLVPIGFGILVGNIPFFEGVGLQLGIYEDGSVLNILYYGVLKGIYPPLIFLGIGAMTDFSALLSNPKLMLLGAAAQLGIFLYLYYSNGTWVYPVNKLLQLELLAVLMVLQLFS